MLISPSTVPVIPSITQTAALTPSALPDSVSPKQIGQADAKAEFKTINTRIMIAGPTNGRFLCGLLIIPSEESFRIA